MMRPDCVTIGDVLKREGYRCGIVGPWHLGNDHQPQHGFTDFWHTYRYQGAGHPDRLFDYFDQEGVPNLYASGAPGIVSGGHHLGYTTLSDPRQQRATWTVDRGLEFLSEPDDRPFLLFLSVKDPHPLIVVPPELLDLYPADQIELSPTWGDALEGRPQYLRRKVGRLHADTDEMGFRRTMAHYYALVTHIDHQMGRVLESLAANGVVEDTIFVFFSDHGEMLGDHGFTTKRVLYEGSVRVPCVLSWPGGLPAGQRVTSPLGGVDLMPSLLELAGAAIDAPVDGRSVASAVVNGREPAPSPVFAEIATWRAIQSQTDDPAELAAHVMVRDGQWKFVWNGLDTDELYDLEADPYEMTNLASSEEHSARVLAPKGQVRKMLGRTGPGSYEWCLQ